jgi:uncharacterized protein YdhG (YjbR/CyaY superfamily)
MQSKATTVAAYLAELPEDRREALATLHALIRKALPGAVESIQYGMPSYALGEAGVGMAAQKHYLALYVCDGELVDRYRPRLGKLNCGKGCIRFKSLDDLPLDVIEDLLREMVQRRQAKLSS